MLPDGLTIGPMREDEIPVLDGWAAAEGWNPGLADVAVARQFDPGAFVALREDGRLPRGRHEIFGVTSFELG
jgi:hypothetical protein